MTDQPSLSWLTTEIRLKCPTDDKSKRALLSLANTFFPEEGQCYACRQYDDTVNTTDCEHLALLQLCESCHYHYCPDGGDCW